MVDMVDQFLTFYPSLLAETQYEMIFFAKL